MFSVLLMNRTEHHIDSGHSFLVQVIVPFWIWSPPITDIVMAAIFKMFYYCYYRRVRGINIAPLLVFNSIYYHERMERYWLMIFTVGTYLGLKLCPCESLSCPIFSMAAMVAILKNLFAAVVPGCHGGHLETSLCSCSSRIKVLMTKLAFTVRLCVS